MIFEHAEKIVKYDTYTEKVEKIRLFFVVEKEKLKSKFSYAKNLTSEKKAFVSYLNNYKCLMLDVLRQTLNIFREYLDKIDHMVILNGSFARNSYRDFSDLDVSIVLNKKKTKTYILFEELFYHALSYVLNMPRDRVHSAFINMVEKPNYEYDGSLYSIQWNDCKKSISCSFRKGSWSDMLLGIETERLYSIIINDVQASLNKCAFKEYAFVYEVVENTLNRDLVKDILSIEEKAKGENVLNFSDLSYTNIDGQITSKGLKVILKDNFFKNFNNFCAYIRHYATVNYNYKNLLDINDILNAKTFGKILGKNQALLRDLYYEYVWLLTRIENCLNVLGYELSSHNLSFVDCKSLKELYNIKYKNDKNVFEELFILQKNAQNIYKNVLKTIN